MYKRQTDIDELADLCDRVIVFHRGRICAALSGGSLTAYAVLEAMNTGLVANAGMEAEEAD